MVAMRCFSLSALAFLSIPLMAPAHATAQSFINQAPLTPVAANYKPVPAQQMADLRWNTSSNEPRLANDVNDPVPQPMQFAMTTRTLWTAQDAIAAANADAIGERSSYASAADKGDCRWSFDGSNLWACKIKPLGKYGLPLRDSLHRMWPLKHKNGN